MGNSEARTTVIYYILLLAGAVKPTSTVVTVTAYDGTGTVKEQPLTLGCNYTIGDSDVIDDFEWRHERVAILAGSVIGKTARFQSGTGWESGVFLGDFTSSLTIQLLAANVTPSLAGQYSCGVISLTGRFQDTATATVQYAPQITPSFPSSRTVTEFSRLQIDCSNYTTAGNPPTTIYTWTRGGSTVSSGAVLAINNISRDQSGQYNCTATNTVGSESELVDVDIQYGPQIESTFPSSKSVTELSRLQINCSSYTTPGNPPTTTYTWTNGGSTVISGAVLDIHNIGRGESGLYTCKASNTVGSQNANVSVNVHFLDRPELLVNKTEVVENETVSLTCNVKSNPTAELAIRNVDNNTVLVERDINKLQFTIDRVQCLHNGSFLCTAGNPQIGNAFNSSFKDINVKCSPRQDFRHKLDNIVVKQINETAALTTDVIANPVPEFRWFRQKSGGLTNISRDTIHSISNSRLQSVLYINISRTQDYGDYVLEMKNSQGRNQLLFTLTSKGSKKSVDEEGSILPIVVGIISAVVVVAVFIVGAFLYRRKQKGLNCCKRKSGEKMEMTANQMYESSTANAGPIYAQPNKQKKAKDVVNEKAKKGLDNGGLQADKNVPKVGLDKDGLTYVQIDTTHQKPAKKTKPRTTPRPTAYASISIGQVGDPLPDEEEKE